MFRTRRALRIQRLLKLAALGLAVFALALVCIEIPKHTGKVTPIWMANALVLSVLLCTPTRRWPSIIAVGAAGLLAADFAVGYSLGISVGLTACNTAEFIAAALALQSLQRRPFERWRAKDCFKFGLVSCGVSIASASLAMTIFYPGQLPPRQDLILWAMADALGLLVITPCLLVLARSRKALGELRRDAVFPFGLLIGGALLSFGQARFPIQFLPAFGLLFVAWRHRTVGAAIGLLLLNLIGIPLTLMGLGPFSYVGNHLEQPVLALQTYLAVCFFIAVPVAAQSDRVRRMHHDLRRALVASREEVHAREEAEARYRLLAENGRDLIMQTGLDRRFSYVSPSCAALTGYSQAEVVGQSPLLFLHPDDAPRVSAAFDAQVCEKPGEPLRVEYRIRTKDGRELWLESRPTALIDPETGEVLGASDVARDITARIAMEDDLREARVEAEAAAQAKSDFLANMSHELRTPLTSVVGYTRLAGEQPELSTLTREYVDRVGDASRALLCVVNDILDFSKLEAGQVTLARQPTSPARLARSTLDLFAPQAGAKDLDLVLDCDLDPDLHLDLDPDRFRQVLLNLVGNAVKFTHQGSVTLSVGYHDGRLTVAVRDTGPGIPEDRQGQLFQRFSQVDGSLTRTHGGTGLGLAICKGLVEAMGGQISLSSKPGEGSSFQFWIAAQTCAPADETTEESAEGAAIPGLRVLVVDDHAANRELAILFLAGVGAEVFEAAGGREAVEMTQRWPFDVILLDMRMPEMDGPATLAAIREIDGPNDATPILAFTADADPNAAQALDALGFQGLVAKPVEPASLIGAVVRACSYSQPQPMSQVSAG